MGKVFLILLLVPWAAIMLIPILTRIIRGEDPARLVALKIKDDANRVLFVFEGVMAPSIRTCLKFANPYDGDVIYVQYGHDGCALDKYCIQIRALVEDRGYKRVDILGFSIGAEVFPTLANVFGQRVELRMYGVRPFWTEVARKKVKALATVLAFPLIGIKILLGVFGEIPFIEWGETKYSLGEIMSRYIIAVWGRPFWREWYLDMRPVWIPLENYKSIMIRSNCRLIDSIRGFVLLEDDKTIDNIKVCETFIGVPVRSVRSEDEYVLALKKLDLYR